MHRLLVTHQLQYLSSPHVSHVVVIKHGTIAEQGKYLELLHRPDSELARLMSDFQNESDHSQDAMSAPILESNIEADSEEASKMHDKTNVKPVQALMTKEERLKGSLDWVC